MLIASEKLSTVRRETDHPYGKVKTGETVSRVSGVYVSQNDIRGLRSEGHERIVWRK